MESFNVMFFKINSFDETEPNFLFSTMLSFIVWIFSKSRLLHLQNSTPDLKMQLDLQWLKDLYTSTMTLSSGLYLWESSSLSLELFSGF